MAEDFAVLATKDGLVRVDLALGNIADLSLSRHGHQIRPLHRAPWADDPSAEFPVAMPFVEMRLSGDFLCAPFGKYGLPEGSFHGPAANSRWQRVGVTGELLHLQLSETVMGAQIEKLVRVGPGPFLYQTHVVVGGEGTLPISTHPLFNVNPGAQILMSPKRICVTPDEPIADGAHRLSYPASHDNPAAFPGLDGTVDLGHFPTDPGTEDFVQLVEEDLNSPGWTAILTKDSVVVVLKNSKVLPITQLWYSNGGRKDTPWNGRHVNVLGIEDAALPISGTDIDGIQLEPEKATALHHAIGAIARPEGWEKIKEVKVTEKSVVITGDDDHQVQLAFDTTFFQ